jgi:hypothetical protein
MESVRQARTLLPYRSIERFSMNSRTRQCSRSGEPEIEIHAYVLDFKSPVSQVARLGFGGGWTLRRGIMS